MRAGDGIYARTGLWALAVIAVAVALAPAATAATPAPDPGGNESADVLPPPDGHYFGFAMGPVDPANALHPPADYAALAQRAGSNMMRSTISWANVEATKDVWNESAWSDYRNIYDSFLARGLTPFFTLKNAPKWARDMNSSGQPICTQNCPPAEDPADMAQWQQFVQEAARRFPLAVFGVWNEPNLAGPWAGGTLPVDPARWERLVASTYDAVKSVNPAQKVIAGALATKIVPEPSPDMSYYDFLEFAYRSGLAGNADGIDFHIYPQDANLGAGSRFATVFAGIRSIKAAHGDAATPLWVSEFGRTTSDPSNPTSEAQQADLITRGVSRMLTMPDVQTVLIYRLDDNTAVPTSDPEYGFGVMRRGQNVFLPPKQAFCDLVTEAANRYPLCPDSPTPVTIDSGPPALQNTDSATFAFSTTEEWADLQCSLDGTPFAGCTSPLTYTDLPDGDHVFRVRAVDRVGSNDSVTAERDFTVDTTAPDTTITDPPRDPTNDPSPVVGFQADDSTATFKCSIDDADWAPCSSGDSIGPLADGHHTFAVRATDPAGNVDASPAETQFTVDTAAPDTAIVSATPALTKAADPSPAFTSDDSAATFECSVDHADWAPCSSGDSIGPLADGDHTFAARATDAAGNVDPTPASWSFTVDTIAPETTIGAAPAALGNDASPTLAVSSDDPSAGFQCSLDGAAGWTPCSSGDRLGPLADGGHSVAVRAIDPAGNADPTPASRSFVIDTVAPQTTITGGPSGPTASANPSFAFASSEGGSTFACRIDGGGWAPCGSPMAYAGLADGSHVFDVRATDAAANPDVTPAESSFSVDTTGPDTAISFGPPATGNSRTAVFAFSSPESGAAFECRLDAGAWASCTSPRSYSGLVEGAHTFQARAVDALGNPDATPASWSFVIDVTPPDTKILSTVTSKSGTATISFKSTDPAGVADTFDCKVDSLGWQSCTSPFTTARLSRGSHTVKVRASDPAGNVDPTPAQTAINIKG